MSPAVEETREAPARLLSRNKSALTLHKVWLGLPLRMWLLAAILVSELVPLLFLPHPWQQAVDWMGPVIVFGAALVVWSRRQWIRWRLEPDRIDRRFVALHLVSLILLATTELALIRSSGAALSTVRTLGWMRDGTLLLMVGSLAAALLSLRNLGRLLRCFRSSWAYAALTTLVVISGNLVVQTVWQTPGSRLGHAMQAATFDGVKNLLRLFYAGVIADPSTLILGTGRFQVEVRGACSGIQGLVLMLVLTIGWLIFARRELRLPRALLLIPASLITIWVLNLVRIAALIAIGDAGHEDVAMRGFHSQAGWLLFNAVALGFLLAANHLSWLRKDTLPFPGAVPVKSEDRNAAAIYLLPFLAVLTASLVGRAASSGFDWLYPLRLAAAVVVLWSLRAEYRKLDWRFGWLGPLAGAAVFAMWLGLSRRHGSGPDVLSMQLATLAPWQRIGWIATRALAAVVTVPIIEELAFRGYIARRVMSADVDAVQFSRLSVLAIAVSAVVFGALHGNMWIAGTVAGMVFALVAKLRGRLGEAVAAHATANLLIAVWVLARSDYRMW